MAAFRPTADGGRLRHGPFRFEPPVNPPPAAPAAAAAASQASAPAADEAAGDSKAAPTAASAQEPARAAPVRPAAGAGSRRPATHRPSSGMPLLVIAALGVVYGDIGTSPLYAVKEVFEHGHVPLAPSSVLGVLSLIFWTMTVVVSINYVLLVLRADNNGEGGLIAMLALAAQAVKDRPALRRRLVMVGMFGTALFYGDGVITPAISVLSAVEGLEVFSPAFKKGVLPITLAVLLVLFLVQRKGTGGIGRLFGPVMVLWFGVLGGIGIAQIVQNPQVLLALNPAYAVQFFAEHKVVAFVALGSVVLCVTGAEALYADMGHFGRLPIRIAWYGWAMPGLVLNYFGQGALLLANPKAVANPFYNMVPAWAVLPLVALATLATVIASQALISGAFSVTKQAILLGFLPRMKILHTSVRDTGQIYVPFVNWGLFVAIVVAVLLFKSSSNLAAAYGIAVTLDMAITTILTFFVIRYAWKLPLPLCLAATATFLAIDLAFFGSTLLKFFEGGWFPLIVAGVLFLLMLTWMQGRKLMLDRQREQAIALRDFLDAVFASPPVRVEGTAVFLSPDQGNTPAALLHNLKHNKVLHEQNLFVKVRLHEVPWIGFDRRVEIESLGHDCYEVVLNFGFKNDPDVPEALKLLEPRGIELDPMRTSYFLSREIVTPGDSTLMRAWRQKLFAGMHRNASAAADYLNLPANRVVELGAKLAL
jgi:KUP system potassium uptake protein